MNLNEFTAKVNELEKASVVIKRALKAKAKGKPKENDLSVDSSIYPFAAHYTQDVLAQYFDRGLTPEQTHSLLVKPVDRINLEGGSIYVRLRTLDELDEFWKNNCDTYSFFARQGGSPGFLSGVDWVFSQSKTAVVKAALRWDQFGIKCIWYDWKNDKRKSLIEEESDFEFWFANRDNWRASQIDRGSWSEWDEDEYQEDCIRRTRDSYTGWWVLANLPNNLSFEDDFFYDHFEKSQSLIDSKISPDEAATRFQEMLFDLWKPGIGYPCVFENSTEMPEFIQYWKNERDTDGEYYGMENEENAGPELEVEASLVAEPLTAEPIVEPDIEPSIPIVEVPKEKTNSQVPLGVPLHIGSTTAKQNPLFLLGDHLSEKSRARRLLRESLGLTAQSPVNHSEKDVTEQIKQEPVDFFTGFVKLRIKKGLLAAELLAAKPIVKPVVEPSSPAVVEVPKQKSNLEVLLSATSHIVGTKEKQNPLFTLGDHLVEQSRARRLLREGLGLEAQLPAKPREFDLPEQKQQKPTDFFTGFLNLQNEKRRRAAELRKNENEAKVKK